MGTPKSRNTHINIFNNATTGKFRTNSAQLIDSVAEQANVTETADSFVNKVDDLSLFPVNTTSDIVLDFDLSSLCWERKFYGLSSFAVPKTVTTSNDTYALKYWFHFEITDVAAVLEFPDHIMADVRWEPVGKTWTSTDIGKFVAVAEWDNTAWKLTILGPYA